ncbi:hypothetical protein RP20_CCG001340 [Aedes albopictus]|nr:hypothetical protein RP20_CCG001340 [Aedes albopictus]
MIFKNIGNITAVFTTKAKGHELIDILERLGYNVTIEIIEGSRHIRSLANINRTSVLFVSVSFIVLMIISLVWLVFYYVQRFRYLQTKDKQSRRLCNVAKRIIAKIPTKSIKSDDKEIDNDCCAICIEPYKVTDVIRVLPCKHEFHKTCIDPWLLEHRTCPMCKMDILKHYGFVVGSSHGSSSSASSSSSTTVQNNPIIADYFSVAPPPPPSNSSTITSVASGGGGVVPANRVLVAAVQRKALLKFLRFTGSQESILQLDLDMEEGDLIDDHSSTDGGYQRRHSVSPLPQIRSSNENRLSRSSSESESDNEHQPSASRLHSNRQSMTRRDSAASGGGGGGCGVAAGAAAVCTDSDRHLDENNICVGCLAAALNKKKHNMESTFPQDDADSDTFSSGPHGSSSLPATLKKYKGNHSTGSCRGMNPPDHYHQHIPQQSQSKLPFKFYKTNHSQVRKVRTPLKNLISQSVSAPCDDGSLTNINLGTEVHDECSDVPAPAAAKQPARRCSLSRTSSSGSESRNFAHLHQQHHQHHHHHEEPHGDGDDPEHDDDGSDETEPNSDNDLIANKSRDDSEAECKKK